MRLRTAIAFIFANLLPIIYTKRKSILFIRRTDHKYYVIELELRTLSDGTAIFDAGGISVRTASATGTTWGGYMSEGHIQNSGGFLGESGPHNALGARGIDIEAIRLG